MLQAFIQHILTTLVEHKSAVSVAEEHKDGQLVFKITVDERDLGRVIGRDGQTIRAIRSLVAVVNPGSETVAVDICE